MKTIFIGDKSFKVEIVDTEEGMKEGLSKIESLKKGHGMLFDFGESQRVTMNMYEMSFSLDMLFISKDNIVFKVETMESGDNDITVDDVLYVLEVNSGEGLNYINEELSLDNKNMLVSKDNLSKDIKKKFETGGSFKMYEEEVNAIPGRMQVLDDTGKVLMNLRGGERIFSIKHTEDLLKLAKEVSDGELEPEELGKLMAKIINIQDTQKPEYVN